MSSVSERLRALTGSHTRVVWQQQQEKADDFIGIVPDFKLFCLDTDDGAGERAIFDRVDGFSSPMITPNGDRIIYTRTTDMTAHVVNWDGSGDRILGPGYASGVWKNPENGIEYVFIRPETVAAWNSKSRPVTRHAIDDPSDAVVVWDKTSISRNWFQVSRDGTRAAVAAPWPICGMAKLPNGDFTEFDRGCWTMMSPDNTYRMWVFDGDHRHVKLYNENGEKISTIDIHLAPGVNGWEIYHPRWSNHLQIITVTGPCSDERDYPCPEGNTENLVMKGGRNVELYIGRMDTAITKVEEWVQITENDKADFFGDVWVESAQ